MATCSTGSKAYSYPSSRDWSPRLLFQSLIWKSPGSFLRNDAFPCYLWYFFMLCILMNNFKKLSVKSGYISFCCCGRNAKNLQKWIGPWTSAINCSWRSYCWRRCESHSLYLYNYWRVKSLYDFCHWSCFFNSLLYFQMYFLDVDNGSDNDESTLENEGENEDGTLEKKWAIIYDFMIFPLYYIYLTI